MAKERTYRGILGSLQGLRMSADAHSAEISHLEGTRTKLGTLLDQALEIKNEQAALTASRQEKSREFQKLLTECQKAATVLRVGIREHYGTQSEKLAAFELQPFRGRPRVAKPVPEEKKPQVPASPAAPPADTATAS